SPPQRRAPCSLRAAAGPLHLRDSSMPLTFTPSFDISSSPRTAAESSVLCRAGPRTPLHPIARVVSSLCAVVDSLVLNTAAFTYLHPVIPPLSHPCPPRPRPSTALRAAGSPPAPDSTAPPPPPPPPRSLRAARGPLVLDGAIPRFVHLPPVEHFP